MRAIRIRVGNRDVQAKVEVADPEYFERQLQHGSGLDGGGTWTRKVCSSSISPEPEHSIQRKGTVLPVPSHSGQAPKTGTPTGTMQPRSASCRRERHVERQTFRPLGLGHIPAGEVAQIAFVEGIERRPGLIGLAEERDWLEPGRPGFARLRMNVVDQLLVRGAGFRSMVRRGIRPERRGSSSPTWRVPPASIIPGHPGGRPIAGDSDRMFLPFAKNKVDRRSAGTRIVKPGIHDEGSGI